MHMCTWSGSRCSSMIWHSFCRANAWKISPSLRRLAKQHLASPLRASHIMRTFLTQSRFIILGTLSLESLYAFSGGGKIVMENTSFANFLIRPSFVCPAGCAVRSAPSSP
jgi:hypothetical protein